ncbi:MAG TPA: exopolysaccharide biosynthesis protein [Kofleriaceae bacterium]|nr:exopolysaccharide biosynthesis protein [Kofleriaceae bacterium]
MDVQTARATIATEPPRRLRLDEMLRELGARDAAPAHGEPAAPPDGEVRPSLTVGALVDRAAEGGFGFLIGVLTLIAIPFVGLSTPFGLAIALLGAQLMFGRKQPWLPARARRRALQMTMLDRVLGILTRRAGWMAKLTRRRGEFAIQPRLIGLGIVLLALGLALPLPIPGSNLVFLIPLFVYAIGLLERDGAWVAVGHAMTLIDLALLVVFGAAVAEAVVKIWHWIA